MKLRTRNDYASLINDAINGGLKLATADMKDGRIQALVQDRPDWKVKLSRREKIWKF